MTTTRTERLRQSDRVAVRMPVEASWLDNSGMVHRAVVQTLLVSRNGGVLRLQEKFFPGQEMSLKRPIGGDGASNNPAHSEQRASKTRPTRLVFTTAKKFD